MVGADAPAGTYSAPELVLCPSAWTNQMLLPFGIQLELRQRDPAEADARREYSGHHARPDAANDGELETIMASFITNVEGWHHCIRAEQTPWPKPPTFVETDRLPLVGARFVAKIGSQGNMDLGRWGAAG